MGTLWSVAYYILTVTDRFRQKKKKTQHGSGREWESFFREWNGTGFFPSFFVGLGREEIHFCGSGKGEVWEFTSVSPPVEERHIGLHITYYIFMHLADAFIQSDLQCIQAIHIFNQYVCSLGIEPTTFCAANTMLYHWATGTPWILLLATRILLLLYFYFFLFFLTYVII